MASLRSFSIRRSVGSLFLSFLFLGCGRAEIDLGLDGLDGVGASGGTDSGGSGGVGGSPSGGAGGSPTGGSGGSPIECSDESQCVPADSCFEGECVDGFCVESTRDRDDDGFTDSLCGGQDCNDLNPLARPGLAESCTDGSDNDCNGVSDCADPACQVGPCGCTPSAESCSNQLDDDCDGALDCNDTDCVGTIACGCSAEICQNGADDDCDGDTDCDDSNCAGTTACQCAGGAESCTNAADDDCDGLVDCVDPNCRFQASCLCQVPTAELCSDLRDNDCDGGVDCGDSDCFASPFCQNCTTESCANSSDDDCDGAIDCADPSCAFSPSCPIQAEQCNNQRDDDFDGDTDCDDSDCANVPLCKELQNTCLTARLIAGSGSFTFTGDTTGQLSNFEGTCGGEAGEAVFRLVIDEPSRVELDTIGTSFDSVLYVRRGACEAGQEIGCDDDSGGVAWSSRLVFPILPAGSYFVFVDGLTIDPSGGVNEGPFEFHALVSPPTEDCDDGVDNDGDVTADCADPECSAFPGCSTCRGGSAAVAEFGAARCTNGIDDDCDGDEDCDDDDCSASPDAITECCDGLDENGNGIPDDFNCRCRTSADCPGGQVCYTSTTSTCGIPCNSFFGEICPFLAPGSACNDATQQCEF